MASLRERITAMLEDPRWRDDVDADWLESSLRAALAAHE